jgi:hypothetical protein
MERLLDEVDMLEDVYYEQDSEESVMLALSLAKRVRRYSQELVKELATQRDSYSQEAQADE